MSNVTSIVSRVGFSESNPSVSRRGVRVSSHRIPRRHRRGMSLIWSTCTLVVLMGFASLAMDLGRVQMAKTELRRTADTAARAGAGALSISTGQALADARAWAKQNAVDNRSLVDSGIQVTLGFWDKTARTFSTTIPSGRSVNACRVVLERPAAGTESVPLVWGKVLGANGVKISAEAIAMYTPPVNINHQVDGVANPFLSGMPAGSVASLNNPHNNPDYAGDAASTDPAHRRQSPPVVALEVNPGDVLQFDEAVTGTVRHDPNLPYYNPDGNLSDIGHNNTTPNGSNSKASQMYNDNGIADTWAPINSLVGVFLGEQRPNMSNAPSNLDFRSAASRDFDQLAPQVKQTFFIGDGMTSGGAKQSFVVPPGATRLFLATWDFYEWNNNAGFRVVKITRPAKVTLVK